MIKVGDVVVWHSSVEVGFSSVGVVTSIEGKRIWARFHDKMSPYNHDLAHDSRERFEEI